MKFGLSDGHWKIVEELLLAPLKDQGVRVWIFGSRARGDFKKYSDLDVLYSSQKSLPAGLIARIQEQLEESRLPIKVDLVAEGDLAASYRESVMKDLKPL